MHGAAPHCKLAHQKAARLFIGVYMLNLLALHAARHWKARNTTHRSQTHIEHSHRITHHAVRAQASHPLWPNPLKMPHGTLLEVTLHTMCDVLPRCASFVCSLTGALGNHFGACFVVVAVYSAAQIYWWCHEMMWIRSFGGY